MNNLFKLFTLVGTGLILGSMASKYLRVDKLGLGRILGIYANDEEGLKKKEVENSPAKQEEFENCFI